MTDQFIASKDMCGRATVSGDAVARGITVILVISLWLFFACCSAAGQTTLPVNPQAPMQLQLVTGHNLVITTNSDYRKLSVAQPEIADVNAIGPRSILVLGKKPGRTQVMVWDEADHSSVYEVQVLPDLKDLHQQLKTILPDSAIEVSDANGTLVLRGRVANLDEAKEATQLATPYAGANKVLNFLQISGGQQVMLQVRFAEVARSALSQLGLNMAYADGVSSAASNIGQLAPFAPGPIDTPGPGVVIPTNSPAITLFGGGELGSTQLQAFLQALHQQNLSRILADPNLVTVSGQEATFLAGGKFPVPVPQTSSGTATSITVDYEEFGVRLNFTPIVLGDGRIRLQVTPEVSDLDFTNGIVNQGFKIPLINTRRVSTTVELSNGQTLAIAGLLNDKSAASINSLPVLGDLPILGALFRSVSYQRNETELVVMVTPRLVNGMNPGEVPPLPGEHWRHPTESNLFLHGDLGGPVGPTTRPATPPEFFGPQGYHPATNN